MADPEGFEPSIPSPVYSLSRGALSTTQPQVPWFVERAGYEHLNRPSAMASVLKSSLFLAWSGRYDKGAPTARRQSPKDDHQIF